MEIIQNNISERWLRRIAFLFTLFLFTFETFVVDVNYAGYFAYLVDSETPFFIFVTLALMFLSFAAFYLFLLFALSSTLFYKALCFLIFSVSVFIEYSYQNALGRFSAKFDIETVLASTSEQRYASILMYLGVSALAPCVAFAIALILVRSGKKHGLKTFLLVNLLFIACFAVSPVLIDQNFPTFATSASYRTATEFVLQGPVAGTWASGVSGVGLRRREIPKPQIVVGQVPSNNIVIIVDESVRGDHLEINGYGRETTPFLADLQRRGVLKTWGVAVSASTGSRFTYNALVTGLSPDDFPDKTEFKINTFPTLFQYAKAMNYKTYFFDGQMTGYWGSGDDKRFIDNWAGPVQITDGMEFAPWDIDNLIAKKVKGLISNSTGNFIFIFKHGSHIPYQSNFPPEAEIWKPSYKTKNKYEIPSGDDLPGVLNSYDNSLRYNIESFFRTLIDDYSNIPNHSIVIYTGDHGQTLFVNGRASHGGSTKEEANVPLFLIGELSEPIDPTYNASHQNIFPTVLDLIEYPPELREFSRAPSLLTARGLDSRPRFFNPDLGTKVLFD